MRYCLTHHGIANEDGSRCDFFSRRGGDQGACDFRELYRKQLPRA